MSRRFIEFASSFAFIFLLAFYITRSTLWSILIAILPTWPLFVLWILCDIKNYERCKKVPKEPYIIGDSDKVEFLTPEELDETLRKRKSGEEDIEKREPAR